MSKGRRAADRRREREGRIDVDDDVDPAEQTRAAPPTMPGTPIPASGRTPNHGETLVGGPLPDPAERLKPSSTDLEVTRPGVKPPTEQPVGGRLVLMGNEAAGEATLECSPCLIGRSLRAHIQLDDPAISRRHIQLTRVPEDNIWVVEDLRSSSGTLLNGELLEVPSAIRHGDVLTLGRTSFRFLWSNYIPREVDEVTGLATSATGTGTDKSVPETTRFTRISVHEGEEPTFFTTQRELTAMEKKAVKEARQLKLPTITPMAMAGIIAVLLLVVGGTLGGYLVQRAQNDPAQLESQVLVLIEEAKLHIAERRWQEAKLRLETALSLVPGHPEAESLMRTVKAELEALSALDEARRLIAAGDFDVALLALMKIPDSSTYAKERDALRAEIYKLEKEGFFERIEALIAAGNYDEAIDLLEDWLAEHPDDREALALMARIRELQNRKPTDPPEVAKAKAAFAVGNLEQARVLGKGEAQRGVSAGTRFLEDLDAFEADYAEGTRALKQKNGAVASAALERAYQRARRVSAGHSQVQARKVGVEWADALYLVGISAIQNGALCDGALKILRAYTLNPEDTKIAAQKRELDRKAVAGLERAKAALERDPSRARQVAKETMCLAPARSLTGSALRKIAKGR